MKVETLRRIPLAVLHSGDLQAAKAIIEAKKSGKSLEMLKKGHNAKILIFQKEDSDAKNLEKQKKKSTAKNPEKQKKESNAKSLAFWFKAIRKDKAKESKKMDGLYSYHASSIKLEMKLLLLGTE